MGGCLWQPPFLIIMKKLGRMALRLIALALIVTILYFSLVWAGYIAPIGSADAVSSATVISSMDDINGEYVVLINRERHQSTLEKWKRFFKGEDVGFIMEDIVCAVASNDAAGIETAEAYRSRLPQNQMTLKSDSGVLVVSKAKNDIFDILIMSDKAAKAFGAEDLYNKENVEVLHMSPEVKNEKS